MAADLVVDATGRGSRLPDWLAALGYAKPAEERVSVDAGYTSRFYRRQEGDLPGARMAYALPTPPHQKRMGALFPVDGDRWLVSLGGWSGDHVEPDEAAFLAFARSLPIPEIARVVERAMPVSDFAVHKFPASLRRRYERLSRFPDGLLAIGDAICSFNPIYGQGMTVSVMEAEALDAVLTEWGRDSSSVSPTPRPPGHVARRYFQMVARIIDVPWSLAVGEDFRFLETRGPRPKGLGVIHRYTTRVHHAAQRDPVVCLAFYNVMNLLARPESLFHPRVALRLAWLALTGRGGPTGSRTAAADEVAAAAAGGFAAQAGEARRLPPRPFDSGPMATTGR
jgi:hypothetical protein